MILGALSPLILGPMGVDPAVVPPASAFVYARIAGMPMWLFFMAAKAYLEARGITRPLFLGGWFGIAFALKKGDAWLKPLVGVIVLVTGVKMLFF